MGALRDPEGTGGTYSLGMLSTAEDDKLASFHAGAFVNVGLTGPSTSPAAAAIRRATPDARLADSPGGTFAFNQSVLDTQTMTGEVAPDQWTFHWRYRTSCRLPPPAD